MAGGGGSLTDSLKRPLRPSTINGGLSDLAHNMLSRDALNPFDPRQTLRYPVQFTRDTSMFYTPPPPEPPGATPINPPGNTPGVSPDGVSGTPGLGGPMGGGFSPPPMPTNIDFANSGKYNALAFNMANQQFGNSSFSPTGRFNYMPYNDPRGIYGTANRGYQSAGFTPPYMQTLPQIMQSPYFQPAPTMTQLPYGFRSYGSSLYGEPNQTFYASQKQPFLPTKLGQGGNIFSDLRLY